MWFLSDGIAGITDLARDERRDSVWLAAAAASGAAALGRFGAGPGRNVVIAHGNSITFFADLFAVWATGACAVCLNPGLTSGEVENVVDFVRPTVVLLGREAAAPADLSAPTLCLAEAVGGAPGPVARSGLDDPALILFTSGTTGTPKGVTLSFRALLARTSLNLAYIGGATLARSLCLLPTHFGHGLIGNCLTPLLAGGELLLLPEPALAGARALGELLAEHRITFLSSVPSFWRLALRVSPPPARSVLRQVSVGSAPLSAALWREIAAWTGIDNVVNMYGLTETANWFAGASARDLQPEDGLIGRPWGGRAAVLRADGRLASKGEGELLLRTPALMSGYYDRPELTAEAMRDGWYRTGDWGRIDGDGMMRLIGRRRNEINRGGVKVYAEEIDLLLESHPAVAEACCFAVPDEISGEAVAVAVRIAEGAEAEVARLRRWCGERIRRECVPERWFVLDHIAKTDRGKIDRDAVRRRCLEAR
jgi:oxalate---CoA ligase